MKKGGVRTGKENEREKKGHEGRVRSSMERQGWPGPVNGVLLPEAERDGGVLGGQEREGFWGVHQWLTSGVWE